MSPVVAIGVVLAIVLAATLVGVAWRSRTGRVRTTTANTIRAADVGSRASFGGRATLLQFSTDFCAPCKSTARLLTRLADAQDGVAHVEINLTDQPELASRYRILQTPTTFILDGAGITRARIGGAPRWDDLLTRFNEVVTTRTPGGTNVAQS